MFRDEDTEFYTIPAAPGWCVSVLYAGQECLTDEPIVAWEIQRWAGAKDFCRTATPICTENYFNENAAPNEGWALRGPAGHYHDPDGLKFDTADDVLAHFKSGRARRARKA
jgi:hypothetical protein